MAIQYRCASSPTARCAYGTGKPPAKCPACKGRIISQEGRWGVFTWTKENRYPASAAHKIYESKAAAEKAAGSQYVVRFIPS